MNLFEGRLMQFTQAQLDEQVALARNQLKAEIIGMLESYAEGCRKQALAQGIANDTDHLRGSLETCQLMRAVISMTD
jgi:hypothetical protein